PCRSRLRAGLPIKLLYPLLYEARAVVGPLFVRGPSSSRVLRLLHLESYGKQNALVLSIRSSVPGGICRLVFYHSFPERKFLYTNARASPGRCRHLFFQTKRGRALAPAEDSGLLRVIYLGPFVQRVSGARHRFICQLHQARRIIRRSPK